MKIATPYREQTRQVPYGGAFEIKKDIPLTDSWVLVWPALLFALALLLETDAKNPLDVGIIHFLNAFAQHSRLFDTMVGLIADTRFVKGGVIVAMFWWAWFQQDDAKSKIDRGALSFGLIAGIGALFVARAFALILPFRARPLASPFLDFRLPGSMNPHELLTWSSFPSDHAAIFFCIATSIWIASRRLGLVAMCYTFVVICLPRMYLGIHYPTDILAGAALGIGFAYLSQVGWIYQAVANPVLYWQKKHPGSFYAFLFLCSYEIANEFDTFRNLAVLSYHALSKL